MHQLIKTTSAGTETWLVDELWEAAQGLPVKRIPIDAIAEFNQDCWFEGQAPTCREVVEHMRRVMKADLTQPIILAADGSLMDGSHRVAKAVMEGHSHIAAVQFNADPKPTLAR